MQPSIKLKTNYIQKLKYIEVKSIYTEVKKREKVNLLNSRP